MDCHTNKSFCLVFVLLLFNISCTICQSDKIHFTQGVSVHIINGLPSNNNPLNFRCQSKDDDLGYHTLLVGEEYYWEFHLNFFIPNTLFFCHFYWQSKDKSFDVFDGLMKFPSCNHPSLHDIKCFWLVKADGFYFSEHRGDPNSPDWNKLVSW